MSLLSSDEDWVLSDLPEAPNMQAAKKLLRASGDGKWKQAAKPGNQEAWAVLQCNAHINCGHFGAIKKVGAALFCIFEKGQHTVEPTLKRRANSILNWDDEAALRKGVEYGNTPGQVHVSLSKEEIKRLKAAGEDILRHKREEGGLKGAQTRRCHVCHVSCVYSALIPSASHWNTENTVFRLYPLCILFPGASYSIPLVSSYVSLVSGMSYSISCVSYMYPAPVRKLQYPVCILLVFQYESWLQLEYCILLISQSYPV